jgi:hypothetical protein
MWGESIAICKNFAINVQLATKTRHNSSSGSIEKLYNYRNRNLGVGGISVDGSRLQSKAG